jgi:hypothetical protein
MREMSSGAHSATTNNDVEMVAWLGRIGAATVEQVGERFGLCESWTGVRLKRLAHEGLLEYSKLLYRRPGMYLATRRGLRLAGLPGIPVFDASPGGYEHAWQMANVAIALHRELPGWRMLAERELRTPQARREHSTAWAKVGSVGDRAAYHRPDFALISPAGRLVVVEVELTRKDRPRMRRICRGWMRARHVEHVYYLAAERAGRAVRRAVEAAKVADLITVLGLTDVPRLAELELERAAAHAHSYSSCNASPAGTLAANQPGMATISTAAAVTSARLTSATITPTELTTG